MFFHHTPNPNQDPELVARYSRPQSLRARLEGTVIVIVGLIVLLVLLSVILSIV